MSKSNGDAGLKWVTVFDTQHAEGGKTAPAGAAGGDPSKRLSVERIYQKKTQLEHILLRPDTYIGSIEPTTQNMWIFDEDMGLNNREITFVPGLYKIFDEILVNAADNKQRDKNMTCIKITIESETNTVSVWNNGKGIPVVEHKVEKMFVPALIFGELLTSSNYNDEEKKVTGGRNGYGAKLCNIFSKKFTVETACKESKKQFKQTWTENMGKSSDSKIRYFDGSDFTCVTFQPDLDKFGMSSLDKDIMALMTRRAYDIAGSCKGVKVFLNGKKLPVTGFRSYVDLYLKDKVDETGNMLKVVHEVVGERWEVCLTASDKGFQQVSFVNSIATTKGGRHVDYVADQVVAKLIEVVKKKNKAGVLVKPFQVKNHIWLFVNCLVENPTFDSQTKENMTLQHKRFGSTCQLSEKFTKAATNCGIVESILNWVKFKAQTQLNKKCSSVKHSKLRGIPKLDDANDAGGRNSQSCTLILTEGDSAKTLAVSGLSVVGRDRYGVFPLRGKMLNVREASHKQIMENQEINSIIKIMGLQYKKSYEDAESLRSLRYGKLMIMTDQDQDGSHIKGLLINFIHHNWPSLLKHHFLEEFITPLVKVSKNKQELPFYSLPEFEEWKKGSELNKTWRVKYYKGLGTSTAKEAKEYFAEMERHRIPFRYIGTEDDNAITLAFSKKKVDDRKEWLTNWMEDRRQRRLHGLPEQFLYGKETKYLTYNDFINKELILFSNSDNERSIPSLVDGLKPGQRKVLFTCFKRNDKREVKVAQLAGSVAEMSAYHHGEQSLMMTIINLAQNFVGSNNVNLLQPIGQFGTRLHGGKDAASPRYIFTMLSPLARMLYPAVDDNLLRFLWDDNQRVEPEWYCPIIPLVLVNGADGIGTGWASRILNYDTREIVNNIRRMLDGEEPLLMCPRYKNFKGTIDELGPNQFLMSGEVAVLDSTTVEITELPVRTWTQAYKETVLEPMLTGTDKTPPLISDYKEYHTDTTVKFTIRMSEEKLAQAEATGLHKVFKLQSSATCNSMVLFDHMGCLRKYESVADILREFYELRIKYYSLRKEWLEGMLHAESSKLNNQARFILEKIEGKITIENKPKKELIQMLLKRGYDSDPIKNWKDAQEKAVDGGGGGGGADSDSDASDAAGGTGPNFNYILNMPLWSLSRERKDELVKQRDIKAKELLELKRKSPSELWKEDLATFVEELDRVEAQEREDEVSGMSTKAVKGKVGKPKMKRLQLEETQPSPYGRRVVPQVTLAMKAEASKKLGRKKVKTEGVDGTPVKMEPGEDGGGGGGEDSESRPLVRRTAKRAPKADKSEPGSKSARKGTSSKKPKRNPWSDSDGSDDLEDKSVSDADDTSIGLVPRENVPRRAAAMTPKKFTFDFSDGDDEDEDEVVSSPPRRVRSKSPPSPVAKKKTSSFDFSDKEDEDDVTLPPPPPPTKAKEAVDRNNNGDHGVCRRRAPEPRKGWKSTEFDWDEVMGTPSHPPQAPAASATTSSPAKPALSSDDEKPASTATPLISSLASTKPPAAAAATSHAKKPAASKKQSQAAKDGDKAKKKPSAKSKKPLSLDSDNDSDEVASSRKPAQAAKGKGGGSRKRKVAASDSEKSDGEYSPQKKVTPKAATALPAATGKAGRGASGGSKKGKKAAVSDDEGSAGVDSDDGVGAGPKGAGAGAKGGGSSRGAQQRERPGRARKQVKYCEASDDDDNDDDFLG
ncbi:DNA topoisomerase 2-alpha-like isoform X1 [Lampetra planeri]